MRSTFVRLFVFAVTVAAVACSRDPGPAGARHLTNGDGYFEKQQFGDAAIEYRNAVEKLPDSADARAKLADAYFASGDAPGAMREYLVTADLQPENVAAQLKAANMLLIAGRFPDAKMRIEQALRVDPKNVDGLVMLGNVLTGMRDFDGAVEEIEEAVALAPQDSSPYIVLGRLKTMLGSLEEAEAAYQKAVELAPESANARLSFAAYEWTRGNITRAEEQLKAALTLDSNGVRPNRAMAAFYIATGRAPEAEKYLKIVSDRAGDDRSKLALADYYVLTRNVPRARDILRPMALEHHVAAITRLAAIADSEGDQKNAQLLVDSALISSPGYVPAMLLKVRLLLVDRKIDEALDTAKAVADADAQSAAARFMIGSIQASRGEWDAATRAFNQVLQIAPRSIEAYIQLSHIHLISGFAMQALDEASRAITIDGNSVDAHLALTRVRIARNELAAARLELDALTKRFPKSAELHGVAGTVALMQNERAAARKSFNRALELNRDSIEALAGLVALDAADHDMTNASKRVEARLARTPNEVPAVILAARTYLMAKQPELAEKLLRRAIDLDPTNLDAYSELAGLYARRNELDRAKRELETLVNRTPDSVAAGTLLAIVLHMKGELDAAQARYEAVLGIDPHAAVAANNLAWLYASTPGGNLDRALDLATKANAQLNARAEVADTLGWIYYKKELLSQSIQAFRTSVEKDPNNPVYSYHLGLAYNKRGDTTMARKSLEAALRLRSDFDGAKDASAILKSLDQ